MRHRTLQIIALLLSAAPAWGQSELPGAIATPLATARLDSVTGMPLFLRMYQALLPAGGHSTYEGSNALLYDLSGDLSLEVEGGGTKHVEHGSGAFIAAGQAVTIRAPASAPADLLLILLTARPNQHGRYSTCRRRRANYSALPSHCRGSRMARMNSAWNAIGYITPQQAEAMSA